MVFPKLHESFISLDSESRLYSLLLSIKEKIGGGGERKDKRGTAVCC